MAASREFSPDLSDPWFGRTESRDALDRALESARLGHGAVVLIRGDEGVGKSALLRRLRYHASRAGFRVLYGRACPSDLPQPFALVQELLGTTAPPPGPPGPALSPGEDRGRSAPPSLFLAPYLSGQGRAERTAAESRPEVDLLLTSVGGRAGDAEESRIDLLDLLQAHFAAMAREGPLLLAIDDLPFADEPSLDFLGQLAEQLPDARIAIAVTWSSKATPDRPDSRRLEPIIDYPGAETVTVRSMTEAESGEYARWILHGQTPGRDELMRWHTQTGGNPLFLQYVVRGTHGPGGGTIRSGLGSFDAVLAEQLTELSEPDRRVLVHAAVLGQAFDFPTLRLALENPGEEALAETIDRLVHRGLLREEGPGSYQFVSERIRADAYGQLTETRRRILHHKVARALEARGATDPAAIVELARQFYLAREDGPAVAYNRRAAEIAVRSFAYPTAAVHLERALECLARSPGSDPQIELLTRIEFGRLAEELGEVQRGEEVLDEAIRRARGDPRFGTELALALLWRARLRLYRSDYLAARDLAQEATGILAPIDHARGLLVAHRVLAVVSRRIGDLAAAERHAKEALRLADRVADPHLRGHVMVDLANVVGTLGADRFDEALELFAEAERIFGDSGDEGARARVLMDQAVLYGTHHRMAEAVETNRRAIEWAEKSRSRVWTGYACMNQAQNLAEVHDPAAGRIALARAAELLQPLGNLLLKQQILMIDGILCEEEGNLVGAEEAFAESLGVSRESPGMVGEIAELSFRRARVAMRRERWTEAGQWLAEAREQGLASLRPGFAAEMDDLDRKLRARSA